MKQLQVLLGATALLLLPRVAAPATPAYSFTLFDVPGATSTSITGINDAGDIVGAYSTPTGNHGFFRAVGGTSVVSFDAPDGGQIGAPLINSQRQIAFVSVTALEPGDTSTNVYLRSADGAQYTRLTGFADPCFLFGLNDLGQVIGEDLTLGLDLWFVANADGTPAAITVSQNGYFGINDADQVLQAGTGGILLDNANGTPSGRHLDLPSNTASFVMSNNGFVAGVYFQAANITDQQVLVGDLNTNTYSLLDLPGYNGGEIGGPNLLAANDFGVVAGTVASGHGFIATPVVTTALNPAGIVNGASYANESVAPGEVVVLRGTGLGPPDLDLATANSSGFFPTTILTTRVLFDGVAAPLIYVWGGQTAAIVPYEVTGTSTQVQVEYLGTLSTAVTMSVAPSAPGVFTLDSSGSGPGLILNQDNTINTAANPAKRGDIVYFYATGFGRTLPAGTTGKVTPINVPFILNQPLPVKVAIGNEPARVLYDGPAPGLVAGISQLNVVVPVSAPAGATVPLVVQVGNGTSQTGVTIALK
jgi:uncharacterized protein (TIGR03437 family)